MTTGSPVRTGLTGAAMGIGSALASVQGHPKIPSPPPPWMANSYVRRLCWRSRADAAQWLRTPHLLNSQHRCTALLGRFRVEGRANGDSSSVMATVMSVVLQTPCSAQGLGEQRFGLPWKGDE